MQQFGHESSVSSSAYSQARQKFRHTAFIELNQKTVVDIMYGDDDYQTFWGHRLLAVDGTKIRLPNEPGIRDEFGTAKYTPKGKAELRCEYAMSQASVLYDVLNRIVLDASLGKAKAYEVDLAVDHLKQTRAGDLLLMDRGYPSYRMLAELVQHRCDFAIRCSSASFLEANKALKGEGPDSRVVTIKPPAGKALIMRKQGLPNSLRIRVVRVILNTGESEVLVTSLIDEELYPTDDFKGLYNLRWGIETFYGVIKTRLSLENFTGLSVESVKQDFYSTMYLAGLESVLTADAQAELGQRETQHPQKVNRMVSFNAVKNHAFYLLLGDESNKVVSEKLTQLFLQNPCSERNQRSPPRKKRSSHHLLSFQKRQKKHCF